MNPSEKHTLEVSIRQIAEADGEAVASLTRQLGYQRDADQIRHWIASLPNRADTQVVLVACLAGEVVGWIEVSLERRLQSPEFALIGGLVVKDGLRGRGIGRRLCEQAEQWGHEHGAAKMRVTSRSSREAAHRFYLRDGYEQVKTSLVFEKTIAEK